MKLNHYLSSTGHDFCPEGRTVWVPGDSHSGTDEEHCPIRCLRDQSRYKGKIAPTPEQDSHFPVSLTGLKCTHQPLLKCVYAGFGNR